MMLPYSYPWLFRRELSRSSTVLDVGCGKGRFLKEVDDGKKRIYDGVELFDPYIRKARKTGLYRRIFRRDIRKASFPMKSYDAIMCSQVMEHFSKEEAKKILRNLKTWTKDTLIIGVPNGHFHQEEYDGNKLQKHHTSFTPEDFGKIGFRVYGQGFKLIYGQGGLLDTRLGRFWICRVLLYILSYSVSPLPYFIPSFGTYLVAVWKRE